MIKIRYADLPEGLHVQTKARGRRTIIYLRPGLTPRERRESLRRALRTAHVGYGPPISAAGLAWAVAADRVRSTLANAVAAVRWHPLGSLLIVAACGTMITSYLLLVSASVRIAPDPVLQAVPPLTPHPVAGPPVAGARRPAGHSRGTPSRGRTRDGRGSTSPAPSPVPSRAEGSPPSWPPAPSPHAISPPPTPSPKGLCIRLGPLGVCV